MGSSLEPRSGTSWGVSTSLSTGGFCLGKWEEVKQLDRGRVVVAWELGGPGREQERRGWEEKAKLSTHASPWLMLLRDPIQAPLLYIAVSRVC